MKLKIGKGQNENDVTV